MFRAWNWLGPSVVRFREITLNIRGNFEVVASEQGSTRKSSDGVLGRI